MISQNEKAEAFQALHTRPGCFVIPNPWDAGSSKILASLGFEALATTSAGLASTLGRSDGRGLVSKEEALANVREIVSATDLPVSADLENGYDHDPRGVFNTIKSAWEAGLVGGSIEDATGDDSNPIYELEFAVERIRAAVEAAAGLFSPFVLTARAENYLHGLPDLQDTVLRLQRFQEAGADVLYAPGLRDPEEIGTLVRELDKPVNVVMGLGGVSLSVAMLTELGVKRISLGSSLNRVALGALVGAAREILDHGTFSYSEGAISFAELDGIFSQGSQ